MGHGIEPDEHVPFLVSGVEVEKNARHLPHWHADGVFCFLTWRLADSIPAAKLNEWRAERERWLARHPRPWDADATARYRELFPMRIQNWLDVGYGACWLRDPACATMVSGALHFFDGVRYELAAFVIMPNHVHVLFQLRESHRLEKVTQSSKGYTALELNKLLGRKGTFWQAENWDTLLRGTAHLDRCLSYIHQNPAKANLQAGEYVLYEAPGFRETMGITDPCI